MEKAILKTYQPMYYNPKESQAIYEFCNSLKQMLQDPLENKQEIVLVCIGSDRATGDCLGPLVGYKLSKLKSLGLHIYGTLSAPVHAKNLTEIIARISLKHKNPFVIAIDASLGVPGHVGYVTLSEGALSPGIGVDKELPPVGDIHITGIVNLSGLLSHMLLQTTRLDQVMSLADFICIGMRYTFSMT